MLGEAKLHELSQMATSLEDEIQLVAQGYIAALETYGHRSDADKLSKMLNDRRLSELARTMYTMRIQGR